MPPLGLSRPAVGRARGFLDREPLSATAERALALKLIAPVGAVLHLHPGALTGQIGLVQPLRHDALERVFADGVPQCLAGVE